MTDSTVTIVRTTIMSGLQQDLTPTNWCLLFLGWMFYWLKNLDAANKLAAGKPFFQSYWIENRIEIPTSFLACIILAMMAKSVPTSMMDLSGSLTIFITGYFSSSILNYIITRSKPSFLKGNTTTATDAVENTGPSGSMQQSK